MKIVINDCFGGFTLPPTASTSVNLSRDESYYLQNRHDPQLVKVVENMNTEDNHWCSRLKVVEWPDGLPYKIADYDGLESVTLDIQKFLDKHREEFASSETPLNNDLVNLHKFYNKKE